MKCSWTKPPGYEFPFCGRCHRTKTPQTRDANCSGWKAPPAEVMFGSYRYILADLVTETLEHAPTPGALKTRRT